MRYLTYIAWLLLEIIKSSYQVIKIIWSKNIIISPTYGVINTNLKNNKLKIIYANSITLTPGTFTIKLGPSHLLIHALTKDNFTSVSSIENKIKGLEQ